MPIITIPQKLAEKDDLIVIPRKEYEALLVSRNFKEFLTTLVQKKALLRAESNFRKGKTLSYHALAKKLGFAN